MPLGLIDILVSGMMETQRAPIPVMLLSGFLGAGKTSCLLNLLTNSGGFRIGIIVNDMAALNVDASLIAQSPGSRERNVVRLQNGCACCDIQNELIEALVRLGRADQFDVIVVELSGVADPAAVRSSFEAELRTDPSFGVELSRIVTLVDASCFRSYLDTADQVDAGDGRRRALSQLLVVQVEAANIVALNKRDLVAAEELAVVQELVGKLNPLAHIEECAFGALPLSTVLGETAASPQQVHGRTSDRTDHSHAHSHDKGCSGSACTDPSHARAAGTPVGVSEQYGITSFVYRGNLPFDAARLASLLHKWRLEPRAAAAPNSAGVGTSPFGSVLRSKGWCWLAVRPAVRGYWSHAGKVVELSDGGEWAPRESGGAQEADCKGSPSAGQEIVFIGIGMDQPAITAALDDCLLRSGAEQDAFRVEWEKLQAAPRRRRMKVSLSPAVADSIITYIYKDEAGRS